MASMSWRLVLFLVLAGRMLVEIFVGIKESFIFWCIFHNVYNIQMTPHSNSIFLQKILTKQMTNSLPNSPISIS